MLKKIRVTFALIFFLLITLLFLDFSGTLHLWLGWMTKMQLIPAILAVNITLIVGIALLTLLFGRVYCSVICPLGVFQDGISHLSGRKKERRNRFRYSPAISWLRCLMLGAFVAAMIVGISQFVSFFEPYSAYGRMASNLFAPLYRWGNNLLAWFAERADSYAFYAVDVWLKSGISLGIALITFVVIGVLAWKNGRTYCNTICPVGTLLGVISRFSFFKIAFDKEKCTGCSVCERRCKASCIDSKNQTIDYTRCVSCFNCLESCKFGAVKYRFLNIGNKPTNSLETGENQGISRRKVLSIMALVAIVSRVKAQKMHLDGGLAEIVDKKIPDRKTPIVPAGAESLEHLKQHCTACQLCVSACPNNVLRPSEKLSNLMQPEMSYERGYCRPECTECSHVCPSQAIKPVTDVDKSSISIGKAVWIKKNCVVNTDNVQCDNCAKHCPAGTISMVRRDPDDENSLKIPVIDTMYCIGCGACEHLCPARPFSAIYVEGNEKHHVIGE